MSKYKYLVLTDLDGTLLDDRGRLTQSTVEYVHKLNQRGDVLFSFSTGRRWEEAEWVYRDLQLKGFVSCCNGSFFKNPHNNFDVYSYIPENVWTECLNNETFMKKVRNGDVMTDKGVYSFTSTTDRKEFVRRILEENAHPHCMKIFFHNTGTIEDCEDTDRRLKYLKSFDVPPYLVVYHFPTHNTVDFELNPPFSNKNRAVEFMSHFYGISTRNIITLGDQLNDMPAALGNSFFVAVKNGIDLLKYAADDVSEFSNNEDAVISEVEAFLKRRGAK